MDLKKYVYDIPNFPKEGILFRDITPLLNNGEAYSYVIDLMVNYAKKVGATKIAAPEARGFLFGCAVASKLNLPFVPVRKPGKLPRETIEVEYDLEYGTNTICIHKDAINENDKVLIVDDLLATGGTALAGAHLCERLGAKVVGMAFVIDLKDLNGRKLLKDYDVYSLLEYEGE